MRHWLLTSVCAAMYFAAGAAAARQSDSTFDIAPRPLSEALLELSRQARIELIFDRRQTSLLRSGVVKGRMSPDQALDRVLAGTGLTARAAGGVFVVTAASAADDSTPVTVPEVLVVGRRSQNSDIPRLETDIQPYRVASGQQVQRSGSDNLDQYFGSRVPSNTTTVPPALDYFGAANSQIDLRGLGSESTLVLIDGRRMPRFMTGVRDIEQPDINPVPFSAIERIEIQTGAAGGIHGFGAEGGVVNVVLDRQFTGAELRTHMGVTSRGDARQVRLEGRFGISLNVTCL